MVNELAQLEHLQPEADGNRIEAGKLDDVLRTLSQPPSWAASEASASRPGSQPDASETLKPGDYNFSFTMAGLPPHNRSFEVHVPEGYDGSKPLPTVYVLHGVSGDGDAPGLMRRETGLNKLADEQGFAVVYLHADTGAMPWSNGNALVQSWNSPGAGMTNYRDTYDDVWYVQDVMKHLSSKLKMDPAAQYLAGFSEGGQFAQHLAGRLPGRFAGIGIISGTLVGTEQLPQQGDDTAVFILHGENDKMIPIDGGRGPLTANLPIDGSQPMRQKTEWARINQCSGDPTVTETPELRVTEYTDEQCQGAGVKEVVIRGGSYIASYLRTLDPGEHTWPGSDLGEGGGWNYVGDKNPNYSASREFWAHVSKNRKDDHRLDPQFRTMLTGR